jgi:hypothetical protein
MNYNKIGRKRSWPNRVIISAIAWGLNETQKKNYDSQCPGVILSKERFFISGVGTFGNAATTGLLYQPVMIGDGDCGEIGGIKTDRGNRSTRKKPAPEPLCPPQILHD